MAKRVHLQWFTISRTHIRELFRPEIWLCDVDYADNTWRLQDFKVDFTRLPLVIRQINCFHIMGESSVWSIARQNTSFLLQNFLPNFHMRKISRLSFNPFRTEWYVGYGKSYCLLNVNNRNTLLQMSFKGNIIY